MSHESLSQRITALEELCAYQQIEIHQLSDELFAQQKEMSSLYSRLHRLEQKLQSMAEISPVRPLEEETPPPHY